MKRCCTVLRPLRAPCSLFLHIGSNRSFELANLKVPSLELSSSHSLISCRTLPVRLHTAYTVCALHLLPWRTSPSKCQHFKLLQWRACVAPRAQPHCATASSRATFCRAEGCKFKATALQQNIARQVHVAGQQASGVAVPTVRCRGSRTPPCQQHVQTLYSVLGVFNTPAAVLAATQRRGWLVRLHHSWPCRIRLPQRLLH